MLEVEQFPYLQPSADVEEDGKCIHTFAILESVGGGVWVECELGWSRKARRNTGTDTGKCAF